MRFRLFSAIIFLGISLSAADFSLENPSAILENVERYIQGGEISRDEYNKNIFSDRTPKNLSISNLYFQELSYSLLHNSAELRYIIKDSIADKKSNTAKTQPYSYSFISIKIYKDAKCQISAISNVISDSDATAEDMKDFSSEALIRSIEAANKFIVGNKIISKEHIIENQVSSLLTFGAGDVKAFEEIIEKKIPEVIKMQDLILLSIEGHAGQATVRYCIKPTLYRAEACQTGFYILSVNVKGAEVGDIAILKSSVRNDDYSLKGKELKDLSVSEKEEIYETVFRKMFGKADICEREIKIRFLDLGSDTPLPDSFFKKFENEKISVRNPFVKDEKYKPETFHDRYMPRGDDALFYAITRITQFDDIHISVDCRVTWALMAARGYTYFLEKTDGGWKVTAIKHTWTS